MIKMINVYNVSKMFNRILVKGLSTNNLFYLFKLT